MQEILPIAAGGLVGGAVCMVASPRLGGAVIVLLSVLFGTAATVASGEFRVSWEFLAVDIPLVALSSLAATLLARRPLRRVSTARA